MMLTEPVPILAPSSNPDAEDLRLYATARDAEAFSRVVRRHIDLVYSLCRRELRDAHLAEDATQAVFILLAGKSGKFSSGVRLTGWLYETSRNCCRNARRSQVRRARHESAAAMERSEMNTVSAAGHLESEELAQTVHAALAQLPRRERDLVLMRYFQRMTARQVAQMLTITEEAAKQRLARAMRNLREKMRQMPGAEEWLERGALMAAPAHLATSATRSATTGAPGASAAIAKGVTAAANIKIAGIVLAIALAGSGGIGAASHFGSPSVETPVAGNTQQAPVLAPIPASNPEEAKGRSTPLNCLRAISAREKALDAAGLQACFYDDGSDMAKILAHSVAVDIAQVRMTNTIKSVYGDDATPFFFSNPTASVVVDLLMALPPPEPQADGDTATMTLHLPPAMMQLGMKDWDGKTLHFVRSPADGGWKINLAASFTYSTYTPGIKGMHPAELQPTLAFLDAVTTTADRVTGEIANHKIASAELVGNRFNMLLDQERAARKVHITGGGFDAVEGAKK